MARKLFLLSMLSWINQDSVICGSQHFFHPAEEDLPKSVLPGALIVGFLEDNNHIPRGVSGGKHEILGTGVVFDAE